MNRKLNIKISQIRRRKLIKYMIQEKKKQKENKVKIINDIKSINKRDYNEDNTVEDTKKNKEGR